MNKNLQPARLAAQGLILCAVAAGLLPLFWFALSRGGFNFGTGVWPVLLFTLKQATASTLLSVIPGFFVARALVRRQFRGRALLLQFFAIPMAVPAIVAVLALTGLYGNAGLLSGFINLYGFGGIVLAHVFFNLPMATRLFVDVLEQIAPENFRLAAQLGFSDGQVLRQIELPQALPAAFRIASLVFLLCAASFIIVLTLGGATATTLEVAIFQSLRMDFDIPRALALSLLQMGLSGALVFFGASAFSQSMAIVKLRLLPQRFDGRSVFARTTDIALIGLAIALVLPPLAILLAQGFFNVTFDGALRQALFTSLGIGACSAIIAVVLAWNLAGGKSVSHILSLSALLVPPAVMATGWFLLLYKLNGGVVLVFSTIVALNALMALPFASAVLGPAFSQIENSNDRLCQSLGISGWNRLWNITLPQMLRPLAQAGLMAFVLSLGDLAAVTLLGSEGIMTLPSLVRAQMGHYRGQDAQGTALVLMALCFAITVVAQRLGRQHDPR
ncbi:MAG: ABC transporter permease subunit [Aestuariivirga sp.]